MNHDFTAGKVFRFGRALGLVSVPIFAWSLRKDPAFPLLLLVFVAIGAPLYVLWPRAIHFDATGIRQRDFFGRTRLIHWEDVDSLGHLSTEGKTIVGGGDIEIVHTEFHQDKKLFCDLIEQRTGKGVFVSQL